jgi:hypothetical protein
MPTEFTLPLHDDFVARHGDQVQWLQASKCPCGSSAEVRVTCFLCHGQGWRYAAPLLLTALVTGIDHRRDLLQSGFAQPGDLLLGLAPSEMHLISDFDLIRLTWTSGSPYEGDLITRRDGPTDILSYEAREVLSCFAVSQSEQRVITYVPGVDFTISGRTLTWISSNAPDVGSRYSIKYNVIYDWVVFLSPGDRYEGGQSLGQHNLLRKRHLVFHRDF